MLTAGLLCGTGGVSVANTLTGFGLMRIVLRGESSELVELTQ